MSLAERLSSKFRFASLLGQIFIFRTISQPRTLSADIPAARRVYLLNNVNLPQSETDSANLSQVYDQMSSSCNVENTANKCKQVHDGWTEVDAEIPAGITDTIESEFAPDEASLNIEPFKFTIRNLNEVSKAIEDLDQAKATGPN